MSDKKVLFEDGSKKVYEADSDDQLIQSFTDNIVSSDGKKSGKVRGKGPTNNAVAVHIFEYLESYNVATHFVSKLSDREMQVRQTDIFPITVQVHNMATPALKKRYGNDNNNDLPLPMIEFFHGKDRLNDPLNRDFNEQALELAGVDDLKAMSRDGLKINALIKPFFERRNIILADVKMHFGKYRGHVVLSSEITPDSCRLTDAKTGKALSSERFDKDVGDISELYRTVHDRILGEM